MIPLRVTWCDPMLLLEDKEQLLCTVSVATKIRNEKANECHLVGGRCLIIIIIIIIRPTLSCSMNNGARAVLFRCVVSLFTFL